MELNFFISVCGFHNSNSSCSLFARRYLPSERLPSQYWLVQSLQPFSAPSWSWALSGCSWRLRSIESRADPSKRWQAAANHSAGNPRVTRVPVKPRSKYENPPVRVVVFQFRDSLPLKMQPLPS